MPGDEVVRRFRLPFFGRRGAPSPAALWLARADQATPEEVVQQYFAGVNAHDLDLMLATMTPERAKLHAAPTTVDRRRQSVAEARIIAVEQSQESVPLQALGPKYRHTVVLKVTYALRLAAVEERKDPTLREGQDWAYFVLVAEDPGKRWMIADWGR